MMRISLRTTFLLALSLTLILGAVVPVALAQDDDPIVIGASLPLTGAFSTAGSKHQEGYELCTNLINEGGGLLGRQIDLIVSDNGSDTEQALAQHERLINQDNVDLLFGTFSSRLTVPVSAVAEQNDMIYPIPAGGAIRIYERGFENLFYFQQNAGEFVGNSPLEMLDELVGQDSEDYPRTAAVVGADDFFANAIADGLLGNPVLNPANDEVLLELAPGSLADHDIEVVFEERWPEEGFSDWLTLANNIKQSDAAMVMGLGASVDEMIELSRAFETVDYHPSVIYYSQGTQVEFLDAVGEETAEGVVMHAAWHPNVNFVGMLLGEPFSNQDFLDAYADAFDGALADEDVAIPFALCQGMTQAVEGAGTTDNPTVRDWLNARTADDPVRTITGDFHWDERGLPIGRSFIMAQWQSGELNFVYPLGEFEGTADLIFPRP